MLPAAGAVLWESWLARPRLEWVKFVYPALMVAAGAVLAPLAIPALPVETFIRYSEILHLRQPRMVTHQLGPLPRSSVIRTI
jgi:hypothetical protein